MTFEVVAQGFGLAEAPLWDRESLLFSDAVFGGVKRVGRDGRVEEVLAKRRGIGGMALDADGGLIVSGRDVLRIRPDGEQVELLGRTPGFAGYNDMGTLADGTLIVGELRFNPMQGETPQPSAIVALRPGDDHPDTTELPLVTWPNGIACAPDGETFYLADFTTGEVWRDAHEAWARSPSEQADGLAVDAEGGVWVATGAGAAIARFVEGSLERTVEVPRADFVSSLCFGGEGLEDAYVTVRQAVLRTRLGVAGLPVPRARV
ncbi:MAG TPA: SMP-30/gluconolactonase/LRE family protein [Solirubrobacteraceae bacterium]|jgi:gluconolactonase|nr:SMP-30/gluconolactonase/LRE family protein [Solirubrobacteraceae bacterium]